LVAEQVLQFFGFQPAKLQFFKEVVQKHRTKGTQFLKNSIAKLQLKTVQIPLDILKTVPIIEKAEDL
jgi:hypothetical protein